MTPAGKASLLPKTSLAHQRTGNPGSDGLVQHRLVDIPNERLREVCVGLTQTDRPHRPTARVQLCVCLSRPLDHTACVHLLKVLSSLGVRTVVSFQ